MPKALRVTLAAVAGLLLAGALGLVGWSRYLHADPAPEALAALVSDAVVRVEQGDDIAFRPAAATPRMGVILYPGAGCDIRGYAPVLRRLAAAGYLTIAVAMPLELAIFGTERATAVMAAHPEVDRWVLVGHSIGGAMAGRYVERHPDAVAGLVLWDTYPAANLSRYPRPVWLVHRAQLDGTPARYLPPQRARFPAASPWIAIRGGVHMYFGSFEQGGYKEDWPPRITRDAQQDQEVVATLAALRAMSAAG